MHILLLTTKFLPGSKEATKITITEFKQFLEQQGHEVFLVDEKSIRQTIQKVKQLQRQENLQFDVIHGFSSAPLLVMKVFLTKLFCSPPAKTVQTLKSYSRNFLGNLYFSGLLNFVDTVTVPTNVFKRKLVRYGCLREKINVIHSFINTEKFIPLNKKELQKKYGYEHQKIVFYYGGLHENKGVQYLIEAFPMVQEQIKNAVLLIAPRHPPNELFLEKVKELGEKVRIVTEDINVVEYLNLADVLVLPYKNLLGTEGNPSCLLEAIACKVPVVTSDLPELREIVTPEEDVLMAESGNIHLLSQQIQRLLSDEPLRKKLTGNAYQKVEVFDARTVTKEFLNLYEKRV